MAAAASSAGPVVLVWDEAQGKYAGVPAIKGRGIQSVTDNGDGTMKITYTDGATENVANEAYAALEKRVSEALGTYIDEVAALVGGDG